MSEIFIHKYDPKGKSKPVITSHQVWDREKFIKSQIEQHAGSKDKPEDLRIVSVVTQDEYRAYKGWKGYVQ
jgi:hypothetical protein